MHISSTTDVVVRVQNEPFNAVSVYVPLSLAAANIVDFDPAWVSAEKPALFTCVVDNYKTIMKGVLLDQWMAFFRQDTNVDGVIYLIVFLDGAGTEGLWSIDDVSIQFAPITGAFRELFFLSFIKTLFDGTYDGRPTPAPVDPGSPAGAVVRLYNDNNTDVVQVPVDNYAFSDGVKDWEVPVDAILDIQPLEYVELSISATTVGTGSLLAPGDVSPGDITPAFPADIRLNVVSVTPGVDPGVGPVDIPSKYFDFSLALAYQCKLDVGMSYFWSPVKVTVPLPSGVPDPNYCWIRSATAAEEKAQVTSIATADRAKYYWGCLYFMECANTWVVAHSEQVNLLPLIFALWFTAKNPTGLYVGNKLHMIRLSGTRIKPFGWPSWIVSDVNVNDVKGGNIFDEKNVAYLYTISDNSVQDCVISKARGVTGISMNATMISKYVDYALAMDLANFISDDGTLTNPVLTDQEAYDEIKRRTMAQISRFTETKRIFAIQLLFPDFAVAKTGLTELTAATSWKALYRDDLDEITITGGITEE
jgi:hypothetical protein